MDEPWFLGIKIRVLLNHSCYRCMRGIGENAVRSEGLKVLDSFPGQHVVMLNKEPRFVAYETQTRWETAQLAKAGNRHLLFLTYSVASTSGEYLSSIY